MKFIPLFLLSSITLISSSYAAEPLLAHLPQDSHARGAFIVLGTPTFAINSYTISVSECARLLEETKSKLESKGMTILLVNKCVQGAPAEGGVIGTINFIR